MKEFLSGSIKKIAYISSIHDDSANSMLEAGFSIKRG